MTGVDLADQFTLYLRVVDGARRVRGATRTQGWADGRLAAEHSRADSLIASWWRPGAKPGQANGTVLRQKPKVIAAGDVGKKLVQAGGRRTVHEVSPQHFDHVDDRDDWATPILDPSLIRQCPARLRPCLWRFHRRSIRHNMDRPIGDWWRRRLITSCWAVRRRDSNRRLRVRETVGCAVGIRLSVSAAVHNQQCNHNQPTIFAETLNLRFANPASANR